MAMTFSVSFLAGAAHAAEGSIGLRLLDTPEAGGGPRAQLYVVDQVAPGAVISRRVEVSNATTGPAEIALYPAGASIVDGRFLGADDRTPNELSRWTTVTPTTSTLVAGSTAVATVTVTVPADAVPGERLGVVWAEVRSVPASGGGLVQVSRVGVRMFVTVAHANEPGWGGVALPAAGVAVAALAGTFWLHHRSP